MLPYIAYMEHTWILWGISLYNHQTTKVSQPLLGEMIPGELRVSDSLRVSEQAICIGDLRR
jgi:hypothetical protein